MARPDGRRAGELRPVEITRGYTQSTPGSVLIRSGQTVVLCTATWEAGVPAWRAGSGGGWVTAEYDMLPGSTGRRRPRNRNRVDGRTHEIQRLIGRSLRAVVDMDRLGENSILIDCDVIQADGGTRTAAITGAFVALADAIRAARHAGLIVRPPLRESVAAVSVGRLGGRTLLDLNYAEDRGAEVDLNVVMTKSGRFVEIQGTGEQSTFTLVEMQRMVALARRGIRRLLVAQRQAMTKRLPPFVLESSTSTDRDR